jgi:outer membrane protein OmpA-like peptidoglycan-associated protein
MTPSLKLASTLVLATLALSACKRQDTTAAPEQVIVATPAPVAAAPAATAPTTTPVAANPTASTFDINSVPVTTAALPPFPYLDWPEKLAEGDRNGDEPLDFDATSVIVGNDLRSVEGHVVRRYYSLSQAKLSALAAERNYDAALKAMGAVQVNLTQPNDEKFQEAHQEIKDLTAARKAFKILDHGKYKSYLIRTPQGNVWIAYTIDDYNVNIVAIEEKALQQSIKPLSAVELKSELSAKGHVAVYMNFDTDKAVILEKDKPTVTEVGRMLGDNGALKVKIEGHTDATGDAKHNLRLSGDRANAVLAALTAQGVDKTRLSAVGMGGSKPVADNTTEAGRALNRRVELVKQG